MEIVIQKQQPRMLAEGGIPFCEVTVALPTAIGDDKACEQVNKFYAALTEGALRLGKELLLPHARTRYEESTDPRRRFTHRPYRLLLAAVLREDSDATEVTRTLTLTHRGRHLFQRTFSECISKSGAILPRRERKRRKKRAVSP